MAGVGRRLSRLEILVKYWSNTGQIGRAAEPAGNPAGTSASGRGGADVVEYRSNTGQILSLRKGELASELKKGGE